MQAAPPDLRLARGFGSKAGDIGIPPYKSIFHSRWRYATVWIGFYVRGCGVQGERAAEGEKTLHAGTEFKLFLRNCRMQH